MNTPQTFSVKVGQTITTTRNLFGYDFHVKNSDGDTIATVFKSDADAIHMLEQINRGIYDAA